MRNVFFIVFAFFIFNSNAQVDSLKENEVWIVKENAVLMENSTLEKLLIVNEHVVRLKRSTFILYNEKLYKFEEGKKFLHKASKNKSSSIKIVTDKDSIADILNENTSIERLIIIHN